MRLVNFLREHPFSTAIRTKVETNFPGSIRTSRKRIKESAVNKKFLSEANKEERLRFAFQHINNVNFWEKGKSSFFIKLSALTFFCECLGVGEFPWNGIMCYSGRTIDGFSL
jgi:hypothetical protein